MCVFVCVAVCVCVCVCVRQHNSGAEVHFSAWWLLKRRTVVLRSPDFPPGLRAAPQDKAFQLPTMDTTVLTKPAGELATGMLQRRFASPAGPGELDQRAVARGRVLSERCPPALTRAASTTRSGAAQFRRL